MPMALPQFDAMATTPIFNNKSIVGVDIPLPPAPPRNPRHVIPTAAQDRCVNNVHNASLTSLPKVKACPILTLGVQHRRHSAPAMLAFRTAFEKMKEKGSQKKNSGVSSSSDNNDDARTSQKSTAEAMDKLNALFPTSPGSLKNAGRRRRNKLEDQRFSTKNATFAKGGQMNTQQILAGLMANASTSNAAFNKTSSSGKLLLGHTMGMPRTPSGARLVNDSVRRVRSSGNILF
jgi:hypothetical protein